MVRALQADLLRVLDGAEMILICSGKRGVRRYAAFIHRSVIRWLRVLLTIGHLIEQKEHQQ